MKNKIYQPNLKPSDTTVNLNNSTQQNFAVSNNQIFPPQTNYLNNLAQNPNNILPTNNLSQGNQLPKTQRKIYVDLQDGTPVIQPEQYCKNNVRTSQYTILSFLPLALINQYKNPFNIFFLVMMIINCIPAISPSSPVTTIIPVVVVLIINLIREAAEDFKKHRNDRRANDAPCYIYKSPKFVKEKCKNINVGNIIRVKKDEEIPADLLIIKSSLDTGFCYMQTANLDGETALKPREAIYTSNKKLRYKSPKTFKRLLNPINDNCFIEIDLPNENIYEINGTIIFKGQKTYFDSKNVLLRGSRLKSVDYVFGVAVYTGKETKLMKNIVRAKLKKADIEKKLLYIIIFLIGFSIFLTILGGVIGIIYRN
jgi:magnesium-transporting ATPase (P-type)